MSDATACCPKSDDIYASTTRRRGRTPGQRTGGMAGTLAASLRVTCAVSIGTRSAGSG